MRPPSVADGIDKKEFLSQEIERDSTRLLAGCRVLVRQFRLAQDREGVETLAREVFHEAVIAVLRNSAQYDPDFPVYPWVQQAALNHVRNLHRKHGREVLVTDEACQRGAEPGLSEEEMFRIVMQPMRSAPANGPTAEELLSLVDENERQLLERCFLEQVSDTELAEQFGISVGAVRQRRCRALRHAREAYEARERFARGGR